MTQPTDPTGQPGANPPQWSAPTEPTPVPTSTPAAPTTEAATSAPTPAPVQPPAAAYPPPPQGFAPVGAPPPVATAPARSSSRKRGVVDIVLVVAAVFAVGGIGFAAGRVTAPTSNAVAGANRIPGGGAGQFGNGPAPSGAPGGGFGGGFGAGGAGITISGEVVSMTADQLTLKLASGQTIQIPVSSSTTYHTSTAATATDVTTGSTVQVQVTRGTGNGGTGNGGTGNGGTGNGGTGGGRFNLGTASDVTVVPQ